jgi:hypothetical protein
MEAGNATSQGRETEFSVLFVWAAADVEWEAVSSDPRPYQWDQQR